MSKENLNICQVSLKGNIPTINENISQFEKYYSNLKIFIICPKKQKKYFEKNITYKFCKIINEEDIISIKEFKKISNKYFKKNSYYKEIQNRLSWYYQQILKLSFLIKFTSTNKEQILMWDADTILIKNFKFFENGKSIKYGTTSEFHRAYFLTNKNILKKLPNYYLAFTNQFIALTPAESNFLIKKLNNYKKKNSKLSIWITHIVMSSISNVHKKFNGSMFSEQELIGHSSLLYDYNKQKLIHGLRSGLNGKLTNFQKKIAILLGYNYLSYEHTHQNINSQNMLKRKQAWFSFIKIIIKKTSNKFFRGLKHKIIKF